MKNLALAASCAFLLLAASPGLAEGLDDAQIAAIVVTANQVDVDAGRLAAATSTDPAVKEFAELMVTDHVGVNQAATELATRLGLTPRENDTSRGLAQAGAANLARLRELEGAAFDAAYVANEVAYHQQVIAAIDDALIPAAANAELKALLVKVRPAFDAHLEHAQRLQKSLGAR